MQSELREAASAIRDAEHLAVSCHVGPDGDALGSALALAHAARAAGKQAVVSFGSPFSVPDTYEFLDLSPLVPPGEFPSRPEVMVVFDTGVPDRLAELAANAGAAETLVIVDHHRSGDEEFGDIRLIDPEAGAAAQLCFYLLEELGWALDPTTARCLLTGIVTDTGRFQYSSTSPEVMRVAGALIRAGARPEEIGQRVYESAPFGYLAVSAAVLGRAVLEPDVGLVWSVLLAGDLERAGIGYEDTDPLIDDLRIAREAGVAALLKQVEGGFKASLRSRGEVDVEQIAAAEGGGGHHNAAGFTSGDGVEEIIGRIREQLRG
jgi:phosphoesterase RecJ-like protein